jgi:amino acid adenylation domain-containing protein
MFETYKELLDSLSKDDNIWDKISRNISRISERQLQTIEQTNNTETAASGELLHTMFIKQAKSYPDRVAVISESTVLSYGRLYNIAADIGLKISSLGAQPNKLVAIVMDKGWEQIAASIGTLFGGAAYLPVSADFPEQRILEIIKLGKANIVLTQPHLKETINWPGDVNVIEINEGMGRSNASFYEPSAVNTPEDLAYVIFTSGSTGTPKGVMIDHRGAINTIIDIISKFGVGPDDKVLALSSLSFDLSVYDIFGILATGASVVVPPSLAKRDPEAWVQLMEKHHVTIWNSVPALIQILVEYLSGRKKKLPDSMRLVLLSGDWIPLKLAEQLINSNKNIRFISLGGATEASIWSIYYPIEHIDEAWSSIPYGKPLSNQRVYVLNNQLRHCPCWVTGDIYISGYGLALGYWDDPEKTSKRFITNPHSGERMYKTGDLGRYIPDGNIEFLGREDGQVKIQGYRIELGEVETAVLSCPMVEAAIAKVVGNSLDERRIVCYFVPKKPQNFDSSQNRSHVNSSGSGGESSDKDNIGWAADQIKKHVKEKLPEYMCPATFIEIDKIPLTANGKVDRKALPDLVQITSKPLDESNVPETELEEKVVTIWKEILGVEQVSVNESFFEMGGNSVHLIRALNKLKEIIDGEIEVVKLFEYPTIRLWCKYMSSNMTEENSVLENGSSRAETKKAHHNRRRQARQVF